MSNVIPSQLVKLRPIAEVPKKEYREASHSKPSKQSRFGFINKLMTPTKGATTAKARRYQKSFNSAAWIKFKETPDVPVSLWITYQDDSGEHAALVEELKATCDMIMLSGSVNLTIKGEIQSMKVCLGGLSPKQRIFVEELYVQRQIEKKSEKPSDDVLNHPLLGSA